MTSIPRVATQGDPYIVLCLFAGEPMLATGVLYSGRVVHLGGIAEHRVECCYVLDQFLKGRVGWDRVVIVSALYSCGGAMGTLIFFLLLCGVRFSFRGCFPMKRIFVKGGNGSSRLLPNLDQSWLGLVQVWSGLVLLWFKHGSVCRKKFKSRGVIIKNWVQKNALKPDVFCDVLEWSGEDFFSVLECSLTRATLSPHHCRGRGWVKRSPTLQKKCLKQGANLVF